MAKQIGIAITLDDIADILKQRYDFPIDTEVCSVEHVISSTVVVIMVHSDTFPELPSRNYFFTPIRPEDVMKQIEKEEQ